MKGKVDFVKYFSNHNGSGNGLIIKGGVRKGKTTLISMIVKTLLDNSNHVIISNVRFHNIVYEKYEGKIFFINSLKQYLKYYSEIPYENPILLVWDDSQATEGMSSKDVMKKEGKILAQFLIFIGKMQTSYIYVAHQSYIPSPILEGFEPLIIYKVNRTEFIISTEIYDNDSDSYRDSRNLIIKMPKPKLELTTSGNTKIKDDDENYLPIMSIAFTHFEFNVDMQRLNETLTAYDVGENIKETVAEFLNPKSEKKLENELEVLKSISYEKIYIALCLKKGEILSDGNRIRDLINAKILVTAREKLRKNGFK